ncbi:MAG: nitrilase-related carbon-nitrogen hydrolase [Armatimonadota bacterium]
MRKGEEFCLDARQLGADIALFPEMWNIGYSFFDPARPETRAEWEANAVGPDDKLLLHFRCLARELNMAIAVTYAGTLAGST